tara:strand:+ start:1648 stop:1830 length:183 start_codon:yes stop_codon:yes gene_type:complete
MIKIETTTEIKKNLSFFIKPLKHRMVFETKRKPRGIRMDFILTKQKDLKVSTLYETYNVS